MYENECKAENELECKKVRESKKCTLRACSRLFGLKWRDLLKKQGNYYQIK